MALMSRIRSHLRSWLQLVLRVFGILAVSFCICRGYVRAAPITFRIDTVIASVIDLNGGASLPFLSPGDPLVTSFTFEPATGGPQHPQTNELRFDVGGLTFRTPAYLIDVRNEDVPNAAPITGSIADPLNTPIVDQAPGSSDSIFMSCGGQDLNCGQVIGHNELAVQPFIGFATDADVLESENLVAKLNTWNAFTFRELSLTFRKSDSNGETYVGAFIGSVTQIPEPRSLLSALIAAAICSRFAPLRARRSHQ